MIKNLDRLIKTVFKGDVGIKTVKQGSTAIYERTGGFFYLELKN